MTDNKNSPESDVKCSAGTVDSVVSAEYLQRQHELLPEEMKSNQSSICLNCPPVDCENSENLADCSVEATGGNSEAVDHKTVDETVKKIEVAGETARGNFSSVNSDCGHAVPFTKSAVEIKDCHSDMLNVDGNKNLLSELSDAGNTSLFQNSDSRRIDDKVTEINQRIADSGTDGIVPDPNLQKVHPRTLWKNIPTDYFISFFKPDTDKYAKTINVFGERIVLAGASQRGRSHAHIGAPRDDDYRVKYDSDSGWIIMVVADGAGSARFSRKGAEIACSYAVDKLPLMLTDSDFVNAVDIFSANEADEVDVDFQKNLINLKKAAYRILPNVALGALKEIKNLVDAPGNTKSELKDFATTFLLTVTKKINDKWLVISFSFVGDGAIVVYDGHEKDVSTPIIRDGKGVYRHNSLLMNTIDSGEYSGQTRFLTTPNIFQNSDLINRITVHSMKDFTSIMLMSDGVSDAKFETENRLENKSEWDSFWQELTVKGGDGVFPVDFNADDEDISTQLLDWLSFFFFFNHDDRTIVVMYKHE